MGDIISFISKNNRAICTSLMSEAARELHASEDDIYNALSKLTKEIKDNIWIYYEDGAIRMVAE